MSYGSLGVDSLVLLRITVITASLAMGGSSQPDAWYLEGHRFVGIVQLLVVSGRRIN